MGSGLWMAAICYTEHGLSCLYAENVECMSSAGSVWYVGVKVVKFYCGWTWQIWIDGRLWSEQC